MHLHLAVAALLIEAAVGYPQPLYREIGHPVTWIGALLSALEARLNRGPARRLKGALALAALLAAAALPAWALQDMLAGSWLGFVALALAASTLLAQRSLYAHVRAVADALDADGLEGGRRAVAMIVGRDPQALDVSGVARAAIESLAENFSDGIVAPLFWLCVAGLPGAALYKAANTADSMIGHRNARYEQFGWAAARFDDLVNLPASRLAALWLLLASGGRAGAAGHALRRDAGGHRSPNAGWPEAAMAGALGLKLAGPRVYGGARVEDAYMGEGRREASGADIRAALRLYLRACVIQFAVVAALAFALAAG
ncbi:MAG: cobalamin biosynthesis protein CobD [Pseudomonadota bacterium]|nr:cobalamin biosynthesis protein CobD [Pseudomonadota bacterium]